MKYGQSLILKRASDAGTTDPTTGRFTPSASAVTVYDDKCDAQELSSSGLDYKGASLQVVRADLLVFLKDERKAFEIKVGDKGTLTRGSNTADVVVKKLRILDGSIEINIE